MMVTGLVVMSLHQVVVPLVTWARRAIPAPVVLFAKLEERPVPVGVMSPGVPLAVWPIEKPTPAYGYIVPLCAARLPVILSVAVVQAAIGAGMTIVPNAS